MAYPEAWLKATIEDAAGCSAFPLVVPEGTVPPFVVYNRASTDRERTLDDYYGDPQGTFNVEIYADGYIQAKQIADNVRAACHAFQGVSSDGVEIVESLLASEADGDPEFMEGRDTPTYVIVHEYFIRWKD